MRLCKGVRQAHTTTIKYTCPAAGEQTPRAVSGQLKPEPIVLICADSLQPAPTTSRIENPDAGSPGRAPDDGTRTRPRLASSETGSAGGSASASRAALAQRERHGAGLGRARSPGREDGRLRHPRPDHQRYRPRAHAEPLPAAVRGRCRESQCAHDRLGHLPGLGVAVVRGRGPRSGRSLPRRRGRR
jgi:hypothetical protein